MSGGPSLWVALWMVTVPFASAGELVRSGEVRLFASGAYEWCSPHHLLFVPQSDDERRPHPRMLDVRTGRQVPVDLKAKDGGSLRIDSRNCSDMKFIGRRSRAEATSTIHEIHVGEMGKVATLVASTTNGGAVSVKGRYVIAAAPRFSVGTGYRVDQDCIIERAPGFFATCRDPSGQVRATLSRFILFEHTWQPSVSVALGDGRRTQMRNQEAPRFVRDGKPVPSTLTLMTIEGEVLANLSEAGAYKLSTTEVVSSPSETHVYAPCKIPDGFDGGLDGVCRYRIDGKQNRWERVFRSDLPKAAKSGLGHIDVSPEDDIYFAIPGSRLAEYRGIWRYAAATGKVESVSKVKGRHDRADHPKVSPSGDLVAFSLADPELHLIVVDRPGSRK